MLDNKETSNIHKRIELTKEGYTPYSSGKVVCSTVDCESLESLLFRRYVNNLSVEDLDVDKEQAD
jgi:hypothetical protein